MHTCLHKVQYYETDKMNCVHHSNYIRWFEECRVDYLETLELPFESLEAMGLLSPVLEINCHYHRPCTFGAVVEITAAMVRFDRLRFGFAYRVSDTSDGTLLAEGSSVHCFLNAEGRSVSLARSYPALAKRFADIHAADTAAWAAK